MVEPFWMRPDEIAKLTDFQIMGILSRQAENVRAMREESSRKPAQTGVPEPKRTENVRCGRAYEYLISTGMTPDEAERVIRSR